MFLIGFILLILGGPRIGNAIWWLVQPARYNLAFPNAWVGLLGILLLPWTTLMYAASFAGGIVGWDWLWLGIGLFADISSYASSGYGGKKQLTAGTKTPPAASE